MLDRILDLFSRNKRLFHFQLTNLRFGGLIDLPNLHQSFLRHPGLPLDRQEVLTAPVHLPQQFGTGLSPHTYPSLAADRFPFGGTDLHRQIADTLDHSVFQHTMEVDRFNFVHYLLTDRIELLFELLLLDRIASEMLALLGQRLQRKRDLPHGIQRLKRFDPQFLVIPLHRWLVLFKVLFGLLNRHDLAHINLGVLELIPESQDEFNGHRHAVDHRRDIIFPLFNPFCDFDLAFTAEERHTPHFLEVKPHGIVGTTERARRQINRLLVFLLGIRLDVFYFFADFAFRSFLRPIPIVRLDDFDIHFTEHRHNAAKLI